jgi:hypothetical protein
MVGLGVCSPKPTSQSGTMLPPLPSSFPPSHVDLVRATQGSSDFRMNLGKLPKMNFPIFDGDHPKL